MSEHQWTKLMDTILPNHSSAWNMLDEAKIKHVNMLWPRESDIKNCKSWGGINHLIHGFTSNLLNP
jgi:hypothetical protein